MRFQRYFLLLFLITLTTALGARIARAQSGISYPPETEVLRGSVQIKGTASHPDFWKYEIAAAPQGTQNWFNIAGSETPVENGVLAVWDTRSVSDGPYTIRLRIVRHDGNYEEFYVQKVVVANAAPPPTPTPETTPTPTATPTPKPPTATPVQLTPDIPTPTPAPATTPEPGIASVETGQNDGGNEPGAGVPRASLDLLRQIKDAFLKGAFYVILAFVIVGLFFGVKNLLTWIYVRFFVR